MGDGIWILVPLTALAIPLAAVVGHVVVKPIVEAISKLAAAQEARLAAPVVSAGRENLEERLASLERTLDQIVEEQDFQRKLLSARAEEAGRLRER